jgi:hypothetical protein
MVCGGSSWVAEEKLRPVVDWRTTAEDRRRRDADKRVLRQARAARPKQAVRKAKSDWVFSTAAAVNTKTKSGAAMGGPQAWQAVKKLLPTRRAAEDQEGQEEADASSERGMSTSAEESAKIFDVHFKALYERKPEYEYDLAVLAKTAQRNMRRDLDSEPTLEEVQKAVKALKVSGTGRSEV